mgnify:CR=1 FL=1
MPDFPVDPTTITSDALLWGTFVAVCDDPECAWTKQFPFVNAMKLEVGDYLPSGEDPNFNTCM